MSLKITTLIENSPGEHKALVSEHGLSFFVESKGFCMVFDTGQSGRFMDNADRLNIDLGKLDVVALSHGHYDHSGGYRALVEKSPHSILYTGKGFFNKKYGVNGPVCEFLGNDFDAAFLAEKGIQHKEISEPLTEISLVCIWSPRFRKFLKMRRLIHASWCQ